MVPLAFLLLGGPLAHCRAGLPRRSLVILVVLTVRSALWLAGGWRSGARQMGAAHVLELVVGNLVVVIVLLALARRLRRRPSDALNFAFHWLLCAWPAWGAFPWLGGNL